MHQLRDVGDKKSATRVCCLCVRGRGSPAVPETASFVTDASFESQNQIKVRKTEQKHAMNVPLVENIIKLSVNVRHWSRSKLQTPTSKQTDFLLPALMTTNDKLQPHEPHARCIWMKRRHTSSWKRECNVTVCSHKPQRAPTSQRTLSRESLTSLSQGTTSVFWRLSSRRQGRIQVLLIAEFFARQLWKEMASRKLP